MSWAWAYGIAGVNAAFIVAIGVLAFLRPSASLLRLPARSAALFLIGFGLPVLSANAGQLFLYTDASWKIGAWWVCYAVSVFSGLLGGAAGLVYAFRMRDDHSRLAEAIAVGLVLLVAAIFAVVPGLIIGDGAPLEYPAVNLHMLILPLTVGLLLLARLNSALRDGYELRIHELAWPLVGFLPYAIYQGAAVVLHFPTDDLVQVLVAGMATLLCVIYAALAPIIGWRNGLSPTWLFLAAIGIGIATTILQQVLNLHLSPLWAAIGRNLLVAGILLGAYRWHNTSAELPALNGKPAPEVA